jgi:hypothetical protein
VRFVIAVIVGQAGLLAAQLGRLMVAWEPVRAALARGGSEHGTDRVALLRAVTDWYRAQVPRLLSHDILACLYRAYRRELIGAGADSPVSATGFTKALQWATAAPSADRPRLIDLQNVPGGQRYAPYPLLPVLADDPGEDGSWPVSDVLWSYAERYFDGDQRRDIGYSALARSARRAAARLLSHTTADPAVSMQLAAMFTHMLSGPTVGTGGSRPSVPSTLTWRRRRCEISASWSTSRVMSGRPRHWFQQAANTEHPEVTSRAEHELRALDRHADERQEAERPCLLET